MRALRITSDLQVVAVYDELMKAVADYAERIRDPSDAISLMNRALDSILKGYQDVALWVVLDDSLHLAAYVLLIVAENPLLGPRFAMPVQLYVHPRRAKLERVIQLLEGPVSEWAKSLGAERYLAISYRASSAYSNLLARFGWEEVARLYERRL